MTAMWMRTFRNRWESSAGVLCDRGCFRGVSNTASPGVDGPLASRMLSAPLGHDPVRKPTAHGRHPLVLAVCRLGTGPLKR